MNNAIISWPINSVPDNLINKLLLNYKNSNRRDNYYKGKDLRASPPNFQELPELYSFLESLNYKIDFNFPVRGNYLETANHYPIHCDTGKEESYNVDYTVFLFPLFLPEHCHSYLFLLNQKWHGEASTFSVQDWPTGWNHMIKDYSDKPILNKSTSVWDSRINSLGIKLTAQTLEHMSIDTIYKWKVGSFISFPCTQLHFSTTDSNTNKIGLSVRLKLKNNT